VTAGDKEGLDKAHLAGGHASLAGRAMPIVRDDALSK
jgi:hypothetical protein